MSLGLNNLFQIAPDHFLQRTVVFADQVNLYGTQSKITHFADLEPAGRHARVRLLEGQHQYKADAVLPSYFLRPAGVTLIKRENPPNRFVFLPEFTNCRLLVTLEGDEYLRLFMEENLSRSLPPPEADAGSPYIDSFAYWDHRSGALVGAVRGTAVLFKPADQPWTVVMQQIVGNPGQELVRETFTRPLNV